MIRLPRIPGLAAAPIQDLTEHADFSLGSDPELPVRWARVKAKDDAGDRFEVYLSVRESSGPAADLVWTAWGKAKNPRGLSLVCNWIEVRLLDQVKLRSKRTAYGQILNYRCVRKEKRPLETARGSAVVLFKIGRSCIRLRVDIAQ